MKIIQSKKHKIGTYKINKISLLCFDDKRFDLDDGIRALAYFRKDLRKKILKDDHKKRDSKRFSQKEEILTDYERLIQLKISVYK